MKKSEIWETVILFVSILSLWPIAIWYNSKGSIPPYYFLILLADLVVLIVIAIRRIKRLQKAMKESKNRK